MGTRLLFTILLSLAMGGASATFAQEEEQRRPLIKQSPSAPEGMTLDGFGGTSSAGPGDGKGQNGRDRKNDAPTGALSGIVTDADGNPIGGAEVRLLVNEDDDEPVAEDETDSRGRFELLEIEAGTYVLTVGRMGFEAMVQKGIPVLAGQELSLRLVVHSVALGSPQR